jgi:hypothetical protein
MFTVYCPRHRSPVLLFADDIDQVVNGPDGIVLHWHCPCGETGETPFPAFAEVG